MTRLRIKILVIMCAAAFGGMLLSQPVAAATFDKNTIMSDGVFNDYKSMTASQINSFLNSLPNSCISPNKGFKAPEPIGYTPTGSYKYGSYVTAGQIIYVAAQVYKINPRVILATLQKEQSLVNGNTGCSKWGYIASMGNGCPDSGGSYSYSDSAGFYSINGTKVTSTGGTCVNSAHKAGFARQVITGTWLLKFSQQRSLGNTAFNEQVRNFPHSGNVWDNSDDPPTCYSGFMTPGYRKRCSSDSKTTYFDGKYTVDSTNVTMKTGATASFYRYTPHLHGNQLFFDIFTSWFGSTVYFWAADITEKKNYIDTNCTVSASTSTSFTMVSGETRCITIKATNTGTKTWSQSFTKVGTANPLNRTSTFASSWLSSTRPAKLVESTVAPNQTGTFKFLVKAPKIDGVYKESFRLVADGQSSGWMQQNATFTYTITVSNPYNGQLTQNSTYLDSGYSRTIDISHSWLKPGQKVYVLVKAKNIGANAWNNSTAKAGTAPAGRVSSFAGTWPSTTRAAALQEATVAKGSVGNFKFMMTAPEATGTYSEDFQLLNDDVSDSWMPAGTFGRSIKVVSKDPNKMLSGQKAYKGAQILRSTKNGHRLYIQTNGALALYSGFSHKSVWKVRVSGAYMWMQNGGDLKLYDIKGKLLWHTKTYNHRGSRLFLRNDANLVIQDSSGKVIWQTGTRNK